MKKMLNWTKGAMGRALVGGLVFSTPFAFTNSANADEFHVHRVQHRNPTNVEINPGRFGAMIGACECAHGPIKYLYSLPNGYRMVNIGGIRYYKYPNGNMYQALGETDKLLCILPP